MRHVLIIACLLVALALGTRPASALSIVTCLASTSGVAFGNYDPTSTTDTPGTGNVQVTCGLVGSNTSVAYAISISPTVGFSAFSPRYMKVLVTPVLKYNLYTAGGAIWGDGTGGSGTTSDSFPITSSGTVKNYTVYGKIPAQQPVGLGIYGDSITVTISY